MGSVNAKSLCVSGTYLLDRAKRLAQRLIRFKRQSKMEVIDGYLLRATRHGASATAVIIDPPGQLLVFDAKGDTRGNGYPVGARDFFDSRVGMLNGPFGIADIEPKVIAPKLVGIGFDPLQQGDSSPWAQAVLWRSFSTSHRDMVRAQALRILPPAGSGYPFDLVDQVPTGTVVFSGVNAYPRSSIQPSYWLDETAVEQLASGFQLMSRTDLGYMSFEYQGMQLASASWGPWTLLVVPVVKNLAPSQAVHWGHSAVLFVLLNNQDAIAGAAPSAVAWSRLWSPDEHSVDFFHNGTWQARPRASISSPYLDPLNSWREFWEAWELGGRPLPAGGSRPNWTDAISAAWFNGRFVVNLRCCALNATLSPFGVGWDYEYVDAGGSAHMRFEIALDGTFAATEVQHEIWDSRDPLYPERRRPFDQWVVGSLDEATVRGVNPVATFPVPRGLAEVRWCMEADRAGIYSGGVGPYMVADLDSGRLEFSITRLGEDGGESAELYAVNFGDLGAGIQGPTTSMAGVGADKVLLPPTASYKLWPMTPMFVAISAHEIGFVCYTAWQDFFTGAASPAQLAVLDMRTGATSIRSPFGFEHDPAVQHEFPVHLSCMQRTVFDEQGNVLVEGVLFVSVETQNTVRISRDSGRTWAEYLTFPRPRAGAYYLGSPLLAASRGGAAILED